MSVQDDPMLLLGACEDNAEDHLETPTKCRRRKRAEGVAFARDFNAKTAIDGVDGVRAAIDGVRAIDMPKRPSCTSTLGGIQTVHMLARPKSRALWIRLDCIDWLVSYAADEHYYQGVSRSDMAAPAVAAKDFELEFDYQAQTWHCKINVGMDKGATLRLIPPSPWTKVQQRQLCPTHNRDNETELTKAMYDKAAESDPKTFFEFWSRASLSLRRKACREYLRLWALAAVQGRRKDFEDEVRSQEVCHDETGRADESDCEPDSKSHKDDDDDEFEESQVATDEVTFKGDDYKETDDSKEPEEPEERSAGAVPVEEDPML